MSEIGYGTSCLLVKDDSLYAGGEAPLYKWLHEEGFRWGGGHGYFNDVNWAYINITSKIYMTGRPGVGVTRVICNHAITLDEFKLIYGIYKKYEGLEPLRMSMEEQIAWHEKKRLEREKENEYREQLTFEDYLSEVRRLMLEVYTGIPSEAVPGILEKEHERFLDGYKSRQKPIDVVDMFFAWDWW